jgi:hypothetical protein
MVNLKFRAANNCHMEIISNPKGGGVLLHQPFDGTWDPEGLRKLAALLKGAADMMEA